MTDQELHDRLFRLTHTDEAYREEAVRELAQEIVENPSTHRPGIDGLVHKAWFHKLRFVNDPVHFDAGSSRYYHLRIRVPRDSTFIPAFPLQLAIEEQIRKQLEEAGT